MEKNEKLFRKVSLERVNNPEQLNDYICVSNPGAWVVLAAVVMLLIGLGVWGVFGALTTVVELPAVVDRGTANCFATKAQAEKLTEGMEAEVNGAKGTVASVAKTPVRVEDGFDSYVQFLGGFSEGDFVFPVTVIAAAPDGAYTAKIVTESLSPISFVLN